jgi:hypothetical protein
MLNVQSFEGLSLVNAKAEIQHPLADEISVAIGDGAMCRFPYSVELAFFKDGEWQESILDVCCIPFGRCVCVCSAYPVR